MSECCHDALGCRPEELCRALAIHTRKITDSCRDKDCIEDLRVYLTRESQSILDAAGAAKVRAAELIHTAIDLSPVAFHPNHYAIDLTFFYKILADAAVSPCRPAAICGLALFSKRAVLCGENTGARIFRSDSPAGTGGNLPTAVVEAIATNSRCRNNPFPQFYYEIPQLSESWGTFALCSSIADTEIIQIRLESILSRQAGVHEPAPLPIPFLQTLVVWYCKRSLLAMSTIPEIQAQKPLLDKLLHTSYLEDAGINEFEHIRVSLRDLIKYIPIGHAAYLTNFCDELLTMDWKESELENDDLKNYKLKAEFYIRRNQDNAVIAKLRGNEPLTGDDLKVLERILWSEVGTKQDYETEYGAKPLGEFVREIVGLDLHAAKEAFSEYLSDTSLDADQIYFVNQIIEYIVHNGLMKDLSILQESPFTDHGSIVEVFTDLTLWVGIKRIIDRINANALAV